MGKDKSYAVDGFYETFDSGMGPVVPDGMESDFAHADCDESDSYYKGTDSEHGAVPEVPSKKK